MSGRGNFFTIFAVQNPHITAFIVTWFVSLVLFFMPKTLWRGFMKPWWSEQQPATDCHTVNSSYVMYCFQRFYLGHVTCILELTHHDSWKHDLSFTWSSCGLYLNRLQAIDFKDLLQENNKRHVRDRANSTDMMSISELTGWIGITIMRNQSCCNLRCSFLTIKPFVLIYTYQVARKISLWKLPHSLTASSSVRVELCTTYSRQVILWTSRNFCVWPS